MITAQAWCCVLGALAVLSVAEPLSATPSEAFVDNGVLIRGERLHMKGQPATHEEWAKQASKAGPEGLFDPNNPYNRLPPQGVPSDFECSWRAAAWKYAQKIQPNQPNLRAVFDALQLQNCGSEGLKGYVSPPANALSHFPIPKNVAASATFYVDPSNGSDANPGTLQKPFKTVERGVDASRQTPEGDPRAVILRAGTHRLTRTLQLGPVDSFLTIQNYNGEQATLTGAVDLGDLDWSPYRVNNGSYQQNVWVARLQIPALNTIPGLRLGGERSIRARYPNANPELDKFPKGWISAKTSWFGLLHGDEPETNIHVSSPNRSFEQSEFQNYVLGVGGTCDSFTPFEGYWCSSETSGGGAFTYRVPAGLQYDSSLLPNSTKYTNPAGAVIQAWRPAHWASWMFAADGFHPQNSSFTWSHGGFQGARGSNSGAEWFIENVFEELDAPNEYYYNATENNLYFYFNATAGTKPPSSGFEATNLKVLISAIAAQAAPITNLTIRGLTIRDAALTYLDPHGMPSGGDWGLQRSAAVFFQGTVNTVFDGNTLIRNDGNGVMLSGFNRDAVLSNNEIKWNGDTAMASWGFTDRIDGTSGEQPRGTHVVGNFVHELGIFEKQSSHWFQAKTAQSTIEGNIFFNGPRALINMNDGFGGDNRITSNLLFNSCAESSDHGPINSWDRQPFLTRVRNGTSSLIPAYSTIDHNFGVANYGADGGCFDTDDGSSWYNIEYNFWVYGGHKSDFNGHNKRSYFNINAFPYVYGHYCLSVPLPNPALGNAFNEAYQNCTCILASAGDTYLNIQNCQQPIDPNKFTLDLGDNKLYAPSKSVNINCGKKMTLAELQAAGIDLGTTIQDQPTSATIIAWAQQLLGF